MYKILGSDQKEYGPVSADQIRAWLAERRLNADSLVLPEGAGDWKPLGQWPEFASALARPATLAAGQPMMGGAPASPAGNPMAVTGLILGLVSVTVGWCCCYGLPFNIAGIVFSAIGLAQANKSPDKTGKGMAIAGLILSILSILLVILVFAFFGMAMSFDDIMREIKKH